MYCNVLLRNGTYSLFFFCHANYTSSFFPTVLPPFLFIFSLRTLLIDSCDLNKRGVRMS